MGKDVIIACDFKNKEETFKFLDLFEGERNGTFLFRRTRDSKGN